MAFERTGDAGGPLRPGAPNAHTEYRPGRSARLGSGTLACPRCDAPVALAGPARPADPLGCPFCGHAGALREFLSLTGPPRPAVVDVRVVARRAA
jgi:hypothetical protein